MPTKQRNEKPTVIIVLGGGVDARGVLTLHSKNRVEKAVQMFRVGKVSLLLMSGGWGLFQQRPKKTEAQAMKDYAVRLGCPEASIVLEEESRDTLGNALFLLPLLRDRSTVRCAVVTSDFHLVRTRLVFRKAFPKTMQLRFHGVSSSESKHAQHLWHMHETLILDFLREVLRDLPDNNPQAFAKMMRREHPVYARRPSSLGKDLQGAFAAVHQLVHGLEGA